MTAIAFGGLHSVLCSISAALIGGSQCGCVHLQLYAWLLFVIALLPVSFIPARAGFVLYLPFAGMALYVAVCLVRFKEASPLGFAKAVEAARHSVEILFSLERITECDCYRAGDGVQRGAARQP